MSVRSMKAAAAGILLCAAMALAPGSAEAVNRCEDRNGRVTYTDEPCPSGARTMRRVDDSPPVQVREAAPARNGSARDDAAKDVAPARAAEAGRIAAGRVTTAATPEQQIRELDEQYARQRRECADLARQIDYARADLDSASGGQRASAELALRRLQEQFKAQCPRR